MPYSFDAVIGAEPRVLILGTMPSAESLRQGMYYAHKRNAFWTIMSGLLGEEPAPSDRAARYEMLKRHGVALWDVLAHCEREGSLDLNIKNPEPNDLRGLIARAPSLKAVFCNGTKAYELYSRFFSDVKLPCFKLCSTSPAMTVSARSKLEQWQAILKYL